jgi:hypothetical protein
MTVGMVFVAIWFLGVAAYLLWQFATNDLMTADAYPYDPSPAAPIGDVPVAVSGRSAAAAPLCPAPVVVH